jgi:predicted naringenin-chalcone synthase
MKFISQFEIIRPPFETSQEDTFIWLTKLHGRSGHLIEERLRQVGCKSDRIAKRGHFVPDYSHTRFEEMILFGKEEADLSLRSSFYEKEVDVLFEKFYPEGSSAPPYLFHVTCTGYLSPSGAQKIVSKRRFDTTVSHLYHMGCYAAIPAIRLACPGTDIVHTELCSLHTNPLKSSADQLVSQTLFADGAIRYHIGENPSGLQVLAVKEEIIPDSIGAMSWNLASWGFEISLAKEIPVLIVKALPSYLSRLGIDLSSRPLFAVHPGGPKILDHLQSLLGLQDEQLRFSRAILKQYGNMSSATLPHIWHQILEDDTVPNGTLMVSLAFGPGLTLAGAVLRKHI